MDHHFNIKLAELYGVDEAIVINNLVFWQIKNKANNKHFYDGRYWTYNSIRAFAELFPYWSEKQIRRILKSLEDKGCVKAGNFNNVAYDRTKWYSVEPLILDICLNGQMEKTKQANGFAEKGEPIPYNKPDSKPYNKHSGRFTPPTIEEVKSYCLQRNNNLDYKKFFDYFEASDWVDSKGNKVKNWKQKVIVWEKHNEPKKETIQQGPQGVKYTPVGLKREGSMFD